MKIEIIGIALSILLLVGCVGSEQTTLAPTSAPPTATPAAKPIPPTLNPTVAPTAENSLRTLALKHKILIGAAVEPNFIRREPPYAQTLAREFSVLTPENAMKFGPLRPSRSSFKFDDADYLVNFAQTNGMQVRGHTLVWDNQKNNPWVLPKWLTDGNFTRDEYIAILHEHIMTVMTRYRGRVAAWDVVNEAITGNGTMRETLWSKGIGQDYIDLAFRFAREADPNAKLIYNDIIGEGLGKKSNAIYALAKGMKERGVPIDGVGLQMHIHVDKPPKAKNVDANIKRFGALGLDVHITELDVRMPVPRTESSLARQASIYRELMQVCVANENCKMFVMWGFTDKHSWVPSGHPGEGAALIFDEQYQPKAAYRALAEVLG